MSECGQELGDLPRVSASTFCVENGVTTQLLLSLNGSEPCEGNRLDYLSQTLPSVMWFLDASLENEPSNVLIP